MGMKFFRGFDEFLVMVLDIPLARKLLVLKIRNQTVLGHLRKIPLERKIIGIAKKHVKC